MLREVPPDWREIEDRVMDLETGALERGLDLAAAWRRASGVAMHGQDALEQLARLAGVSRSRLEKRGSDRSSTIRRISTSSKPRRTRSTRCTGVSDDRAPELLDLAVEAQARIRRFAIEERLEHGLPPIE